MTEYDPIADLTGAEIQDRATDGEEQYRRERQKRIDAKARIQHTLAHFHAVAVVAGRTDDARRLMSASMDMENFT